MNAFDKQGWNTTKNIFFPGFIDEEDLPILYSHAIALCFVSHYEGFGLPPLEAMACGTPIIYGNASAMPEVIQDAGLAANPNYVSDIQAKMGQLLENHSLRKKLGQNALDRASFFSRKKMALNTLNLYHNIIEDQI